MQIRAFHASEGILNLLIEQAVSGLRLARRKLKTETQPLINESGDRNWIFTDCGISTADPNLFAVGDPDVFDLGGVLEEEAVGGGGGVEPVDGATFVGEGLF